MAGILLLGAAPSAQNFSRPTINVSAGYYMNLAKGWNVTGLDPTLVSSDGYPLAASTTLGPASFPFPSGYFGKYVWKFSGAATMQFPGQVAIIYSGGTSVGLGGSSGQVTANLNILATAGSNPRVVFKFGALVSAVSGGSGSLVTITTSSSLNFGAGLGTGTKVVLATGVSSNLAAGPNSDGSWTITNVSGTQFTLNGSTGVVSPTITNTAVVGTNSEAVVGSFNANAQSVNFGTFSSWSNLVFCREADETDVDNGLVWDSVYVNQLKQLFNNATASGTTYGWLRFMDVIGVQGSFECDFSQRIPKTYIGYGSTSGLNFRSGYWATTITNGGSDAYTCSDPSVTALNGGGSYLDNAIVQGTISGASTGQNPTLAVGGGPAKPIYKYGASRDTIWLTAGAPSPGTDIIQITFSATWLNTGTPVVFSYSTIAGDNNLTTLTQRLQAALAANGTLSGASISFLNSSSEISVYSRTPLAGALSVSYTSGPAILTVGHFPTGTNISNASRRTFIFNYLMDGWIFYAGAMVTSIPLEAIVELCNRVGAHCWYNWGTTKGAYVTAVAQFMGDAVTGLTSGIKFGGEVANEVWNPAAFPYPVFQTLGQSFNWTFASNNSVYSYTALRTKQYGDLSAAAWVGKGRAALDHYIFSMFQSGEGPGGSYQSFGLNGTSLVTSNALYNSYSGLNGTGSVASYNASPNRPADIVRAIGEAPYWTSRWNSGIAGWITGPVSENIPWLQAAQDYALGNTSTAFTSMANQFNGTTTRASGVAANVLTLASCATHYASVDTICASYDAGRGALSLPPMGQMHYEGGPQWAVGADRNNGVNSVNTTDINALVAQMTALGWTVGQLAAYTLSGTGDKTECATQVLTMMQAWKYDATYATLIKTGYYQALLSASTNGREAKGAQYGYSASQWGLFPTNIFAGNQYQNYNAISDWSAGS